MAKFKQRYDTESDYDSQVAKSSRGQESSDQVSEGEVSSEGLDCSSDASSESNGKE